MKHLAKSVSGLSLALALVACGISPEERLDRAETAFVENRYSEARLDLASVLEEDAANATALELMARTQLQLGDGDGAASTLARLEELGHKPGDFATLMAEADLLRGRYEEALVAGKALASAEGARIAALAHIGLGDPQAAQAAFEAGQQRPGDASRLLSDYALFILRAGDPAAAERLATSARSKAPQGLDPLVASARIAEARGKQRDALGYYTAASERYPESRPAILGRIGVLGNLGRLDEARPMIEQLARRTPEDSDVLYLQARLAAEEEAWGDVRDILQPVEQSEDTRLQLLYARA
ncbi:MAG: tetratricopeptide repeat protein, partial [Alteraurantiacibacter sp.]